MSARERDKSENYLPGLALGIALAILIFCIAARSMGVSRSFYLAQEDKYKRSEVLGLKDTNEYLNLYHVFADGFSRKDDFNTRLQKAGNPKLYENTFSEPVTVSLPAGEPVTLEMTVPVSEKMIYTVNELKRVGASDADRVYFDLKLSFPEPDNKETPVPESEKHVFTVASASFTRDGNEAKTHNNGGKDGESTAIEGAQIKKTSDEVLRFSLEDALDAPCTLTASVTLTAEKEAVLEGTFSSLQSLTASEAAQKIGGEWFTALTESEEAAVTHAGTVVLWAQLGAAALTLACAVWCIFTIARRGRRALLWIGLNAIVAAVLTTVALDVCVIAIEPETGWHAFLDFSGATTAAFYDATMLREFSSSLWKFYSFLMLIPLFVGYVLMKVGTVHREDPNDDYLYQ